VRRPLILLVFLAAPLAGQSSPFIPLDHPLLPLAEHLIARGDLADPTPMIRPFRRADLIAAIDRARLDPATPSGRIAARLRRALADPPGDNWFRIEPMAGIDGFTRGRRDLFRPAGAGGIRPFISVDLAGRFGPILLVSRPTAENRLKLDPDWAGSSIQLAKRQAYRFADAYLAAEWRHLRLFFGQMDRNWGPSGVGALGLSIAEAGYPRTDAAFDLIFDRVQIDVLGTRLTDMVGPDGRAHHRYFMAHRLNIRPTKRLDLAIWETGVLAGADQAFDPNFANPLLLFSFPAQFGLPDNRNTIIGGDLGWRVGRSARIQAQAMIDDLWRHRADPSGTGEPAHPGRWAATLAASGALGPALGWRARLGVVSSLAYRTIDSAESFLDRGVGIGPQFPDHWALEAGLTVPVRSGWLVTPLVTLLRQGEGRIDTPFPTGRSLTDTPELLIGTVATTVRIGGDIAGQAGPFRFTGTGGYFHTANPDQVPGRSRNRFEARVRLTLGFATHGAVQ
jgi:hypothetical protein